MVRHRIFGAGFSRDLSANGFERLSAAARNLGANLDRLHGLWGALWTVCVALWKVDMREMDMSKTIADYDVAGMSEAELTRLERQIARKYMNKLEVTIE